MPAPDRRPARPGSRCAGVLLALGLAAGSASAQAALAPLTEESAPVAPEPIRLSSATPRVAPRPAGRRQPWQLGEVAGEEATLEVEGEFRLRFEYLDDQFKLGLGGNSHMWALRTGVAATYRAGRFSGTVEVVDARQEGIPSDQPLTPGDVNTFAVLQAYAAYRWEDVFGEGDQLTLQAGRHTMDVGSRRLIARNVFRNTINGFNGLNAVWEAPTGETARVFAVLPVVRLPFDQSGLRHNDYETDVERSEIRFFGAHVSVPEVVGDLTGELYAYHVDEEDAADVPTRDRDLTTVGARLRRKPSRGAWHGEIETMWQFGESRATPLPTDVTDLDHRAQWHAFIAGYTFDTEGTPRVELLYDHASGDEDPADGDTERFDPLFGANVGTFGRTGLYSAFFPINVEGPGYRASYRPTEDTTLVLLHRFFDLEERRDSLARTGLRDTTGGAGTDAGQFAELRLLWEVEPGAWRIDFGVSQLWAGQFQDNAPSLNGSGDATYVYAQSWWWF